MQKKGSRHVSPTNVLAPDAPTILRSEENAVKTPMEN